MSAHVRREQIAYIHTRGLSHRRACALLSVARSTIGYGMENISRYNTMVFITTKRKKFECDREPGDAVDSR